MNFHCTKCAGCCTRENFEAFDDIQLPPEIRFKPNGNCVNLTAENKCAIYERRPYLCSMKAIFTRPHIIAKMGKVGAALAEVVKALKTRFAKKQAEKEWYKFVNSHCNGLIEHLKLSPDYLINIDEQYKEEQVDEKL